MPGGIEWFRWYHGSVTDPKFGLVAKRAGVRTADVIAVWVWLLERASANDDRGDVGLPDFEAADYLLGLEDGVAQKITGVMSERGLLTDQRITSWEKRQPNQSDATAAHRKRAQRERDKARRNESSHDQSRDVTGRDPDVTHGHAGVTPCHAREEEMKEEKTNLPWSPLETNARFDEFWAAWPANERKQDKAKCVKKWKAEKLDSVANQILADVAVKLQSQKWREGFVEAPMVYLNGRRWEDSLVADGAETGSVGAFV